MRALEVEGCSNEPPDPDDECRQVHAAGLRLFLQDTDGCAAQYNTGA